jgi:hypothetical protein
MPATMDIEPFEKVVATDGRTHAVVLPLGPIALQFGYKEPRSAQRGRTFSKIRRESG